MFMAEELKEERKSERKTKQSITWAWNASSSLKAVENNQSHYRKTNKVKYFYILIESKNGKYDTSNNNLTLFANINKKPT